MYDILNLKIGSLFAVSLSYSEIEIHDFLKQKNLIWIIHKMAMAN